MHHHTPGLYVFTFQRFFAIEALGLLTVTPTPLLGVTVSRTLWPSPVPVRPSPSSAC